MAVLRGPDRPRGISCLMLVACLLRTGLSADSRHLDDDGDIQRYLLVLDYASPSHPKPMAVLWGLADARATVGKLFQYTLPAEAFKGDVTQYKVQEWGGNGLPAWLTFDPGQRLLRGIPGEEDVGQEHLLQVTAVNQVNPELASQVTEVFTVAVVEDDTPHSARPFKEATQQGLKPIHCTPRSPVTMVTIVVDAELSVLSSEGKISLLDGMCQHLGLPPELLKLLALGNRPMLDSSALVAGPGDVKQPQHSGATVQWVVGCGNVNAAHMPVLQQLESTSQDGSMNAAVKHGIIGWHVTNNRPNAPIRLKRRAQRNFTPTPNEGSSGPPTQQPVPTYHVDESDLPATRMVPTMVSPSWDIQPSMSRHHRRHRTKGRHKHHRSSRRHEKHQSPTHHTSNHKTKFTRTPMPTPTVLPIRPSRSMDISPTMVDTVMQRVTPSVPTLSSEVSRTASIVEPSMSPIMPPITKSTQLLPISTHIIHPPLTTEPIRTTQETTAQETHIIPTTKLPVSTTTTTTSSTAAMTPTSATDGESGAVTPSFDYAPILRNDIDRIEVEVGDILNYTIPSQTFFDFEDGNTENLKLVFMTVNGLALPRNSWVKFDQKAQVLYGLPLPEHEGRHEYIMAAIDRNGNIARDTFEILVYSITESTQLLPISTHIIHPPLTTEPIRTTQETTTAATQETHIIPTTKLPVSTTTTTTTSSTAAMTPTSATDGESGAVTPSFDYAPILRNDIDRIEVEVGDILNYTIPSQTFFDFEDGNTENLKLVFMTVNGLALPRNSWVKFDQKAQVLYGLPLPEHEGRHEYIMAAIDRNGNIARDVFEIWVQRRAHGRKINHEFSLNLGLDYRHFLMDVERRINVARKLASLYGDSDSSKITVTRIEQGSVIYTWTNNSLPYAPCPESELGDLYRHLMLNNNSLNPELVEYMQPLQVKTVTYNLKGSCTSMSGLLTNPPTTDKDGLVSPKGRQQDMLITAVFPAIIIAVMFILAACIVFMLYRKYHIPGRVG